MQKDTHTLSNHNTGNAAKDYPLGSHSLYFMTETPSSPVSPQKKKKKKISHSRELTDNEADFLVL